MAPFDRDHRQRDNKARLQHAQSKVSNVGDDFGARLAQSLDVVRRALDEFGGDTGKGLAISFNGGKDACVVLYLLLFVLAERDELWRLYSSTTGSKVGWLYLYTLPDVMAEGDQAELRIPVVYFEKEEFPEIDYFMREVADTYGFDFQRYNVSYKDGMQDLVESRGTEGVIMGQRRGDPWTESMDFFTPSTPGWAQFTRVNPALEWRFCDVWRLLRGSGLPYCVLYDQGYTSLGERGNTAKNEVLRLPDGHYRPAYELAEEEEHLERSPRTPASSPRSLSQCDGGGGGDGGGGDGTKRFSSWDQKWDSLDADPIEEVGESAAATAAAAAGAAAAAAAARGATVGIGATSSSDSASRSARVGADSESPGRSGSCTGVADLEPDGKVHGGGGDVIGWGAWLPVTTLAWALVLVAFGLRTSSGSFRGERQGSAPAKGD